MRSASQERSEIFAQAICAAAGKGRFQFRVILFPHGKCFYEEAQAGRGEGEQAPAAVGGVGGDFDKAAALEGLEGGGEGGAVHGEEGGHGGHAGRIGAVERHHQGELAVGQSEGAEGVVEAARERTRGPLHVQAEAAVPDVDRGLVGDLRVADVYTS